MTDTMTVVRDDEWYVAINHKPLVTPQGETREEAVENLRKTLATHYEEAARQAVIQ